MPLHKAFAGLVLVYLAVGGTALWQLRRYCLLERDVCDASALLESTLSNRFTLIGSILVLAVLLQITWHVVRLAREGKLGIEEDPPEPKFDINGLTVAMVLFVLYLAIALVFIVSASNDTGNLDPFSANLYVWKLFGPVIGATLVYSIFWHLNDYFTRPAHGVVLLLLFFTTLGAIYWAIRTLILDSGF